MRLEIKEEDQEQIEEAVRRAESITRGEIVPAIVGASDSYGEAPLLSMLAFLVAGILLSTVFLVFFPVLLAVPIQGGILVLTGLIGFLLGHLDPVRRIVLGKKRMGRAVAANAHRIFIQEEVFQTRDRTGVLILVSLFERKVEILADTRIHEILGESAWVPVADSVAASFAKKEPINGLVHAIRMCGELLQEKGFPVSENDVDEIPDRLRINP